MTSLKYLIFLLLALPSYLIGNQPSIEGELKKWHKVSLVFNGPKCSENDDFNPFVNYRLDVTFTHKSSGKKYVVPGFFAADGNAADTSADSGNIWKVHFSPDEIGIWDYKVLFKKGHWASIRPSVKKLQSVKKIDGLQGNFEIAVSDKTGKDFRARGRLQYVGKRYLELAENGERFFKCGPDAPENLLAYYAFDGNFAKDGHKDNLVKTWEAHLKDWKQGDPTWKDGKGKELIGAMNYLASKGMNAISFLTCNIEGDDRNVFPYIDYNTYDRIDVSKMAQWDRVFTHAQKLGLFLHFKTLEAENQGILDYGGVGGHTKLYYRELIARFGYHLALNWNLCEEVGDWAGHGKSLPLDLDTRRTLSKYIASIDPYSHHMVIHNGTWFTGMYGNASALTGASLQTHKPDFSMVNSQVSKIIRESTAKGKVWAVATDEPGDAQHALIPDAENPEHYNARTNGLWGTMLAGGWGTEWYFGYKHAHSDLTCQDYRSRDLFWNYGKVCLDFFNNHALPLETMKANNNLVSTKGDFCLAKEGEAYLLLLKKGGESQLDFKGHDGEYKVQWYNPRSGGSLESGSVSTVKGSGSQSLGLPPADVKKDWIVLVQKKT